MQDYFVKDSNVYQQAQDYIIKDSKLYRQTLGYTVTNSQVYLQVHKPFCLFLFTIIHSFILCFDCFCLQFSTYQHVLYCYICFLFTIINRFIYCYVCFCLQLLTGFILSWFFSQSFCFFFYSFVCVV